MHDASAGVSEVRHVMRSFSAFQSPHSLTNITINYRWPHTVTRWTIPDSAGGTPTRGPLIPDSAGGTPTRWTINTRQRWRDAHQVDH